MPSAALPPSDWAGVRHVFVEHLPSDSDPLPMTWTLDDVAVSHHVGQVARIKRGEALVLVDAHRERACLADVLQVTRQALSLQVTAWLPPPVCVMPPTTLVVAVIKEPRWDWLLQKATELGVRTIQPILAERSVIRLKPADALKKQARWQAILRAAAEQSEGWFIPQMELPVSVSQYVARLPHAPGAGRFLLQERGADRQALKTALSTALPNQPAWFAIGPEGGWSEAERHCFVEQGQWTPVSLGSRILRSETAALAAMSAWVYHHDSQQLETTE